ncbi:MAG: type II toxin-antitoxin system RelE/ParE family toxin [Sphingobacteriales bacterium]|nr:type II toxin-antitoxin system RelE/ParE family toxin [Sphingobacteriales bacterium]
MANYKIVLFLKAQKELNESYKWYEKQKSGLSLKFLNQVDESLKSISNNPEFYPVKERNYREFVMKVYPYLKIYKIKERTNEVLIFSIFHSKRNPKLK